MHKSETNRIKLIFRLTVLLAFGIAQGVTQAQVVTLSSPSPGLNEPFTLYFHADQGNKALRGHDGDVYLHTGVITNKSLDGHDWKYVVGNWGKTDEKVKMKREGKDLYSFKLVINQLYPLAPEDQVRQLAFVFRNADGTLVGKTSSNEDITIPVNGYKPPQASTNTATRSLHSLKSTHKLPNQVELIGDWGQLIIMPVNANVAEVSLSGDGTQAADSSHAVPAGNRKPMKISYTQTKNGFAASWGKMRVEIEPNPLKLSFFCHGKPIATEETGFYKLPEQVGFRFALHEGEKIYGTGERALPMDRRGKRLNLYNRPFYAYEWGAAMLNYSLPLVFSSRNYALLFDNPQKGYVDIGASENGVMEWGAIGGPLRYYVIGGQTLDETIRNYAQLTGLQGLPPRWVLGNLQSRMAYRNQAETDSIVELMLHRGFPMDAIILDFYWFGDSIQGHLGNLDWYYKAWPHPEQMISRFRENGIKTILITEPYVIDSLPNHADAEKHGVFVTDSLGRAYLDKQFYFGTGSLIDIFKPEAREWFWAKYQKQIQLGVAAWWGDLGEPESHPADIVHVAGKANQVHNIYGHYWDRMLYEKYAKHYPNQRLFHLQRSGFAGSQRYSAFPWTGDVSRSWSGLKAQMPLLLTMSISGLGYIHSDAGGFAQGVRDDTLYTRWLQFATFTPIMRPHGSGIPSEPVYWSNSTQDRVKATMKLRYTMLPYNYTLAWKNATQGEPLMRPLFYQYPADTVASRSEDEYFWGDGLLVAPVLEKGLSQRLIYFPKGEWYDFYSGAVFKGNQSINFPLSMETIPVFAKAGSFVPMTQPVRSTDLYKADNYKVLYFPDTKPSSYVQYEDDGQSKNAVENGQFETITYSAIPGKSGVSLAISSSGNWPGKPAQRTMVIEIPLKKLPKKVSLNGIRLKPSDSIKYNELQTNHYTYDGQWLRIGFLWNGAPASILYIP